MEIPFSNVSGTSISSSFRHASVYPTQGELLGERDIYVKTNIIKGPFASIDEYLEVHFRLLREDFVASVREGIASYRAGQETTNIEVYQDVEVFKTVSFTSPRKVEIRMTIKGVKLDKLENSKKFLNGSLLIFTKNGFKNVHFAKIILREQANFKKNTFIIQYVDTEFTGENFVMAEPSAFFESYCHVLRTLQNIRSYDLPMQRYIINADTSTSSLPSYLSNSHSPKYEIERNIFDLNHPSTFSLEGLNSSQMRAFKAALTEEFVVIQGPPGTGKTFLGLHIAKALLQNSKYWYHDTPMLIISHKNHVVDQFLEGLLSTTERLVRVGRQSKSELLKKYTLHSEEDEDGDGNKEKNEDENTDENGDEIDIFVKMIDRLSREVKVKKSDLQILQEALVVGMTTTCAARMRSTLQNLRSPIVIVEEAAEVLEAHVIAALNSSCKHLILLGDHKQLQPLTSDKIIGREYHLGLSLFERMVNNGIQCYQLEVQHRMRPEIAGLLRATVYPFLQDHDSVKIKPPVYGVTKNVFFIDHRHPEKTPLNSTSKENDYEAEFLVAFARYLILNNHKPEDIAILATYSGQVRRMKREVKKLKDSRLFSDVIISTLDGFQGQESEIILLSLVRSDSIGFLSTENRICVALSRAKTGYYIMGNMDLLSRNSEMWKKIGYCLETQQAMGIQLVLQCQLHPEAEIKISSTSEFSRVQCGGCNKRCMSHLSCGHVCTYFCHVYDRDHKSYFLCTQSCKRRICAYHPNAFCSKTCGEACGKCYLKIFKTFKCGFACYTECSTEKCPEKCSICNVNTDEEKINL